jgi:hypothetical protein
MMGFEYTNSKGIKFYLHRRGGLLFFSKDPTDAIDLPEGFEVKENPRTGLPIIKKK